MVMATPRCESTAYQGRRYSTYVPLLDVVLVSSAARHLGFFLHSSTPALSEILYLYCQANDSITWTSGFCNELSES